LHFYAALHPNIPNAKSVLALIYTPQSSLLQFIPDTFAGYIANILLFAVLELLFLPRIHKKWREEENSKSINQSVNQSIRIKIYDI